MSPAATTFRCQWSTWRGFFPPPGRHEAVRHQQGPLMSRHTSARPCVEVLEAREVPALGLAPTSGTGGTAPEPVGGARFDSVATTAVLPTGETLIVGTTVIERP